MPHRASISRAGWGASIATAVLAVWFATRVPDVVGGLVPSLDVLAVPSLDVSLSLLLDPLALLFSLLVTGIGSLVLLYAPRYMGADHRSLRLIVLLLLFMLAMLGVVTSGSLWMLYVAWELTSLTSYLLIGFDHDDERSRKAALQALLVTAAGGLALLAGLILLADAAGTADIRAILAGGSIAEHPNYPAIVLLVLLGAFTKSAQVPFHFWLPGAMAAPTPVSAYLHSATMVKAGIFLMARLSPALGGTELWSMSLLLAGGATMLLGAVMATAQTDLKRILAFTTVSALGTLTMLLGIGTPGAIGAMVLFLLVHALYKGALFLAVGAIDHEAGSRDLALLGGLRRAMPLTAGATLLAALSMAGVAPMLGFIGKEVVYAATLESVPWGPIATGAAVAANAVTVALAAVVFAGPFLGALRAPSSPHEAPPSMLAGPLVLAALGVVLGLMPGIAAPLIGSAATAVAGVDVRLDLAMWHGFSPVLALSAATLALGALLYAARRRWPAPGTRVAMLGRFGPQRLYELALASLVAIAGAHTRVVQNGHLRVYVAVIVVAMSILVLLALQSAGGPISLGIVGDVRPIDLLLSGAIISAAIVAVVVRSRLFAVIMLGVIGYGVALTFILMGAPDLAITQFAIETLTVVLFVLVIYRLPRFARFSSTLGRARDLLVSIAAGAAVTLIIIAVSGSPVESRLSAEFVERSLPEGKGRNVVNVILVDFRAFDTLGEIVVLAVAAAGVATLLGLRSRKEDSP